MKRCYLVALSAIRLLVMIGLITTSALADETIDHGSTVIVDGQGPGTRPSPWILVGPSTHLTIGNTGEGTLRIENGGVVSNGIAYIGKIAGSNGIVTVTGPGSEWNSTLWIDVAERGTGTLTISDGGVVRNSTGYIGNWATGEVLATGVGTLWVNRVSLQIGIVSNGTLTIADGAQVSAATATHIAFRSEDSTGTLHIRGVPGKRGMLSTPFISRGTGEAEISIDGGMLQARGHEADFLRNFAPGDIQIEAGGAYIDSNDFDIGIGAALHGPGDLIKLGAGTLRLTGTNSYKNTFVEDGTLFGNVGSISGDVHTASTGSIVFEQASDAIFANKVNGNGKFNKAGEGLLQLTGDSSGFSGNTTITAGTLSVGGTAGTGKLGGTVNVASGGTLSGSGVVGAVTVSSGGTLAPGNSIGTLTVNGDLVLQTGSRYAVEVDPQGSATDLVQVTGTATLGGSVVHVGANGHYPSQATWRILSAGTGLNGTFDEVTSNLAFLTPSLTYDYGAYTVDLTLRRNGVRFSSLASTPNQIATAQGLESLPQNSALLQRILGLPEGAPAPAFDALSGEAHAGVASALLAGADTIRSLPLSQLRSNLSAGMRPGAPIAQAGPGTLPAGSMPRSAALPLWADVFVSRQIMDGNDNTASIKQTTSGLFLGGDQTVGHGWRLGAALGYTDGSLNVHERDSQAKVKTYSAALYGGKAFALGTDKLNLLAGLAYSLHDIDTTRQVALADWHHTLKASYRGHTKQVFGEVGYAMSISRATIEPYAGLAWSTLSTSGFSESGGPTALSADSQRDDMTASTVGLRASRNIELGSAQGRLHASLAWRHAFGALDSRRTMRFDAGQPFTVAGTPVARNAALIELGTDLAMSNNMQLGISYRAQLASGSREHVGKLHAQWRF